VSELHFYELDMPHEMTIEKFSSSLPLGKQINIHIHIHSTIFLTSTCIKSTRVCGAMAIFVTKSMKIRAFPTNNLQPKTSPSHANHDSFHFL